MSQSPQPPSSTPPTPKSNGRAILLTCVSLVIIIAVLFSIRVLVGGLPASPEAQAAPDPTADALEIQERQAQQATKEAEQVAQERIQATEEAEQERLEMFAGCRGDAECWSKKHDVDAGSKCARLVERWAKYDYEWTNGWTQPKFRLWGWANREEGILRYTGDHIKFQNGFGAWQRMYYACDYNTETGYALAGVEAR